jgi:hypothetical protein
MRHVFTLSVAPGPRRMGEATAPARLITTAGGAQRVSPRRPGTPFAAINLAAIAMAADHNLSPAAPAQKEPRRRRTAGCVNPASTRPAPPAIIPPHSCPRTVQGHGADATARLGSAPCRSPNRMVLSHRPSGGETAPPSIPVSGCPGGQTGDPPRAPLRRSWGHCATRAGPPCSLPGQPYARRTQSYFAGIRRLLVAVDTCGC